MEKKGKEKKKGVQIPSWVLFFLVVSVFGLSAALVLIEPETIREVVYKEKPQQELQVRSPVVPWDEINPDGIDITGRNVVRAPINGSVPRGIDPKEQLATVSVDLSSIWGSKAK